MVPGHGGRVRHGHRARMTGTPDLHNFRQLFGLRAACPKSAIIPKANWNDANA
jgi:hypothetical protein